MKKLVMGIIISILLSSSVAFGASIIKNSYFNPELKLIVNGNEVQDIQIVTVEVEGEKYGRNYYSIADVLKALNEYGGINAELSYDAETKTTTINVQQEEAEEVISKMSIMSVENESEEIMEETNEVVTQNPMRNQEPYSSIDKSLVGESTFNNFVVMKYNNNYFIQDKDAETLFNKEFKYSLSKGTIRIANVDTYERAILTENKDYIIIDYVVYFNVNLEI